MKNNDKRKRVNFSQILAKQIEIIAVKRLYRKNNSGMLRKFYQYFIKLFNMY